ncbi:YceI family protein [Psychroserpens sp. NJDZ02]|uniref:YceI family protein n=1 Tax=Psychroserpens sp. NJDZ02 TaxID=2570561 RepID=UPI0010A91A42|nr:YceI family protein [Psychroserpens sp. NJDZ02]QCE40312.1 YceI family protein [Psychroserpens sp. NJDZ02]
MKKIVLNLFAVAIVGLTVVGCKSDVKEAKTGDVETVVENNEAAKFKADPTNSMIVWKANKIVGGHEGTINVSNGVVEFEGDKLVGGSFMFDINTIKCTDIPADDEANGKLIGHLKGADFFDAEQFATAAFEITKVDGKNVSGNLTMKGIKKNITFPATVVVTGDDVTLSSDTFSIDRTEWNIMYNSGKTFDAAALGDKVIKDDVEIKIMVKAKKA